MDLSAKEKANFFRVCQLLVDKGGDALRAALRAIHPPSTLAAVLNAQKSALQKMKYKVITDKQWNLLFPTSGTPDSKQFDITLLTILLRSICALSPPAKGWNATPPAGDTSKSADIVRIKIFRNDVYAHIASTQLEDTKFITFWQEISKPLIRLGIPQKDIDEIEVAPLSPEEGYLEKLKEWKERELELRSCLPDKLPMFTGREKEIGKTSMKQAKEYYREAIQLSESYLGDHELTSSCYKHSGDLFFKTKEFQLAENEYTTAKTMREKLDLDVSEKYAFKLKNLGGCLIESERANEAIEVLETACDIVEKLPESAKLQNVWFKRTCTSLAIAYDYYISRLGYYQ